MEQRTAEGVEGGGRGTETEKRDGGKRPRSSNVLILLVSRSCPRGHTGPQSPKQCGSLSWPALGLPGVHGETLGASGLKLDPPLPWKWVSPSRLYRETSSSA